MSIKKLCIDFLRPFYRQYLSARHHGDVVQCNLCSRHFSGWRPLVGRHADGTDYIIKDLLGSCWLCNSYPRTRQLYHWLTNTYHLEQKKNIKILHIAPEMQLANKILKLQNVEYTCVDKRCEGYTYPKYVKSGDVTNLQFEASTFDLVICNHVLEHIDDDRMAMAEIRRVLKQDGVAILMVPIDYNLSTTIEEEVGCHLSPEEREATFGQYDHVRLYGIDYFERLTEAGFKVDRISYDNDISNRFGFERGEEIVICRKQSIQTEK